ncbi:MAG: hypothetical protein ABEJ92_04765 [Halobacteriales archaeon]
MSPDEPADHLRQAGARLGAVLVRAIAAVVVLVMFGGLAYLVYVGRLDGGALLLYAGVILGYIIHATKQSVG